MIKLIDILNEALDPVGQEDNDINNDGHNRVYVIKMRNDVWIYQIEVISPIPVEN